MARDERLTLNYGLRYERINPLTEVEDRLNGVHSRRAVARSGPTRRAACVFPGDPGIGRGIAHGANAFMPRIGVAWDPTGRGIWSVRSSYGALLRSVPERRRHRVAGRDQRDCRGRSSTSSAAPGLNFQNPYQGRPYPAPDTFVRPSTVFAIDLDAKPPYTQHWNVGVQRSLLRSLRRRSPLRRRAWAGACRETSRRTRRSTRQARRRRTPIGGASTRTAPPTAARATSRRSRCCATSRDRRIPRGQFSLLAALRRRARTERVGTGTRSRSTICRR